jgi:hypothetical protein
VPAERGDLLPDVRPAAGTGEFFLFSDYSWVSLGSFTAPPWNRDGRAPVHWRWEYDARRGRWTLLLVLAPQVAFTRRDTLATGLPAELVPEITVVRAPGADLVPDQTEAVRLDEIIGVAEWVINGYRPEEEDYTAIEQYLGTNAIVLDVFKAQVLPRGDGVSIVHALNHWRVDVTLPENSPATFAYEIVQPTGFDPFAGAKNVLLGAAHFRVRVAGTGNVVVGGATTYSLVGEQLSTLRVEQAVLGLEEVPPQGADLSGLRAEVVELPATMSPGTVQVGQAAEFAIGMIPVVGSVVGLAHVGYMAATGHTLWGDEVSQSGVVAQGIFALLGCIGDTREAAEILAKVSERLYPGVKLVSLNPGPDARFVAQVAEATNGYVLEALERLKVSGEHMTLLHTLDETTAGLKPLSELGRLVEDTLWTTTSEVLSSGELPERMVTESLEWVHPANLDSFDALPLPRQHAIIDAYESVRSGVQRSSYLFDRMEPELAGALLGRMDEWRVGRVMNVFRTGFRPRRIAASFARYVSGRGPYNAVQWAASRIRGRDAAELELLLGKDFRSLVRQMDPEQLWNVSAEALAKWRTLPRGVDFYVDLTRKNRGTGLLFQSDHGLEYRFFRRTPGLSEELRISHADVRAVLVPANPAVAAQLPAADVLYAHSVKTAMLARLIPFGTESVFTLQEVLDAYTLVYVHWLNVPLPVYQGLVVDVLTDAAHELGQTLDLNIWPSSYLLNRNPSFR